jgi:hypothetical protein
MERKQMKKGGKEVLWKKFDLNETLLQHGKNFNV